MGKLASAFLGLVFASTAFGGTVDTFKVRTPRGVDVDAIATYPDAASATSKVPAIVIAPGQGYHMALPIIQEFADKAAAAGIASIRFNWNYFSTDPTNGEPSTDLKNEIEDMQMVLNYAKAESRVDATQILLAGKSLGTFVAYDLFKNDSSLKGLVLMTPVCTQSTDENDHPLPHPLPVAALNYPGLTDMNRSVVMALGNADDLCSVNMLYDFLKDAKATIPVVVVAGNHSWNLGPGSDPVFTHRNAQNVDQATSMVAHWVSVILGR